jgi:hypothetical protein
MKNTTKIVVAIICLTVATASYAQMTTTTLKLIKGSSLINFTPATGGVTATYTWPTTPSATKPMQSSSTGALSFAPITLSDNTNQVTGVLPIANGGTNSSYALTGGKVMVSNGSAIVEGLEGTANGLLHGDLTWGGADLTSQVTGILPVANGGTGAESLSQNAILLGNGTDAIQSVVLNNNKILVGNTSAAPTGRGIVGGNGITVTVDSANITITNALSGSSSATGQVVYTSDGTQLVTVTPSIPVSATSRIILTVMDNVTGNLIAAGVTAITPTTFTISVSTDVNCRINWQITNP